MEEGAFGVAGRAVVIESCLRGEEVSFLAFVDGERFAPLAPSRDHKRVFDGNLGPNTGGMGAYAPVGELTSEVREEVVRRIVGPAVTGLAREGRPFAGMLYAGLMLTSEGPKVLEFNARFGDPEAQVVLPLLRGDVVDIMTSCVSGNLRPEKVVSSARAAVCVVLASAGYPGAYRKGLPIHGLDAAEAMDDVLVFHAGTAGDGPAVTAGGRVLGVTGLGNSLHAATGRAYAAAAKIRFEGAHYRRDIAAGAAANREGGRTS
jgi:phosphoribosylamine--glycine ligase